MSFFISRMPADGLMSRPPVSNTTPLPTIATRGRSGVAPTHLDHPRRARRHGGAADGVDQAVALAASRSSPRTTVIAAPPARPPPGPRPRVRRVPCRWPGYSPCPAPARRLARSRAPRARPSPRVKPAARPPRAFRTCSDRTDRPPAAMPGQPACPGTATRGHPADRRRPAVRRAGRGASSARRRPNCPHRTARSPVGRHRRRPGSPPRRRR